MAEQPEGTPEDITPEPTPEPVEVPDWLNEPQYSELIADESNKNILSRYKEQQEAVKALVEKEKVVRSGFKLPEKLTDEHMQELMPVFDKIMEVPEKPEGYDMVRPEEIPEDMDISEQLKMEIRAVAKEGKASKKLVQAIYETALRGIKRSVQEEELEIAEQQKTERRNTIAEMQKYWGPQEYLKIAGDKENNKPGLIEQFIKTRAIDDAEYNDLNKVLTKTGARNHPLLFKVMGDAARMWKILEGQPEEPGQYVPNKGNQKITEERQRVRLYPNTPASLGGGKPG